MYGKYFKQYQARLKSNILGIKRSQIQIEDDYARRSLTNRTGISIETLKRASWQP